MFASRGSPLPHNKLLLAAADVVAVAGALLLAVLIRLGWHSSLLYVQQRAWELIALACVFPVVFYVGGLYDTRRLRSPFAALVPSAFCVALGTLLSGAVIYLTWSQPFGRGIVATFAFTLLGLLVLLRWVYAQATQRGVLSERCLVVGSHVEAANVLELIDAHPDAGLRVIGRVCDEDVRLPENETGQGLALMGDLEALEGLVGTLHVDRIIIARRLHDDPALLRRLRPLRYRGVALMDLVSLYEELAREVPLDHVDEEWLFHAALTNSRLHIRRLKRVTDVVGALLLLVPATPILAVAALAIKLTSRGPVLFRQERVGLGSKPFMVLKLRTMYEDAEILTGPVWSTDDDPRITRVGRFLRKFRIDELPQLFNVLCGDMSLVGPRPERPVFVEKLCEAAPFYAERLHVRPGITGWAQVMAPYASTVSDSIRKLQFDLYYAKHMSLSLDLLILVKTAKTMLLGRERDQGGMVAGRQLEVVPEPMRIERRSGT